MTFTPPPPRKIDNFSLPKLLALLIVVAAMAGALTFTGGRAGAADPSNETLTLQPGDNFVGWVAEPIDVAELFAQIPEARLIYRWDADTLRWQYTIRAVGGNFDTLEPGMAARIRIFSAEPVEWARPLTPAKGLVTLSSGVNWVAWNGRDQWPLDQVARGIGTSLVSIEVGGQLYQPGSKVSDGVSLLTGDVAIGRGDALQVTVNRDLRWLQPTGMMPHIEWVGNVPQSLRDTMTGEIGELLDYFAETHGVETDFSDTTILIWHTVNDAVAYQDSNPAYPFHLSGEALRVYLEHDADGGGTGWGMHLHSSWWHSDPRQSIFKTHLTHEWFHYLQIQYTDFWRTSGIPPEWMLEGTASWSGDLGIRIDEGHLTFEQSRRPYLNNALTTAATLRSAEQRNTPWQYQLGLLAVDLLVERNGADSIVEYFRQQHPQAVGTDRQWQSATSLADAFSAAFGVDIDDFYVEFEEWRDAQPGRRVRDSGEPKLRGSLHDADGQPATGFWINAHAVDGEYKAGRIRRSDVDEDGNFVIDLEANTVQRLWFTRDGCTLWLTKDGLTQTAPQPGEYRDLNTRRLSRLNLTLPEGACKNELRLSPLFQRGDDRSVAFRAVGQASVRLSRQSSGTYSGFAPHAGQYRLRAWLDGCVLWYHEDGLIVSLNETQLLDLGEEPLFIEIHIPNDLCVRSVSGRLIDENGDVVEGIRLWMPSSGFGGQGSGITAIDGSFSITVPDLGDYRLMFQLEAAGCRNIYYSLEGATADRQRATVFTIADQDLTDIEFVIPTDPASLCD